MAADSNSPGEKGAATRFIEVSRIEAGFFPFAMISPALILILLVVGFPPALFALRELHPL